MKPPKLGYAKGGETPKRYTTKQWNELNTKAGYKVIPGAFNNPDATYMEYYDPKLYTPFNDGKSVSWTKIGDPNWKYSSEANSPWIKYTPPVEVPKTSIVKPMADPNRKPLVFGSGSTYDPNTGKYYNPTNQSQEIKPQILQYKKGGVVSKIKGYASGGVTTYDNDGNPLDESGNPVVADNMQSRDSTSALNQDNEAKMNDTVNTADSAINNTSMQETKQSSSNKPKFDSNAAFGAGASLLTGVGVGLATNQAAKIDAKGKDNRGRYTSKGAAVKGTALKGTALGTQIGGAAGSAFGPLGSLVGAGAGAAIGSGVGALVGVRKGKKDASSIDSSNKKMAAEIAVANQQSRQQQAILNRNNGILDATLQNPYNQQNASFDEKDNLVRAFNKGGVVSKVKQMCSDGGKIKKEMPKLKPVDFKKLKANYEEQTRGGNQMDGSGISAAEMAYRATKLADPTPITNVSEIAKDAFVGDEQNLLNAAGLIPIPYTKAGIKAISKLSKKFNKLNVYGHAVDKGSDFVSEFSNGGTIKGDGGPKEDKINAKIKPGSFVVPAKNAEAAEELREKILMKSPRPKANLIQSGGAKVKLSNGEHLFTPEEKEELLEKGIDVNLLAPNAENKEHKIENKNRVMFPKVVGFADGGLIKGAKVDNVTWDGKNWVSPNGSKYTAEKGKIFTDKYNQLVAKEKSSKEQQKATEISVYSRKLKEAADSGNTNEANKLQAKINELSGTKASNLDTSKVSDKTPSSKPKAPKSNSNKFVSAPPISSRDVAISELQKDNELRSNNDIDKADYAISSQKISPYTPPQIPPTTQPNKLSGIASKIGKGISNVDPTAFLGIGQGILGYNMLKGQVRPVDKAVIDPTYNEAVNRSINDARFGLTPEQQAIANNDIEAARRDAAYAGLVTSGGSGVQAYNTAQNAANQAWKAKLGLKVADQDLRMQKQQYADAQVANRANILAGNRRQAFNDAMGTFQQKQQAGSELIGAGLANTIGAYRFNQSMKNRNAANDERNSF